MTPSDVEEEGCLIISAWDYEGDCTTYTIKFYNSTPNLLDERAMTAFGSTGKCNVTFNYSIPDSYTFNISSGDTGSIIVEVDDTLNLAVILGLTLFALMFIGLGFYLFFRGKGEQ
jgi:hypothetical protein